MMEICFSGFCENWLSVHVKTALNTKLGSAAEPDVIHFRNTFLKKRTQQTSWRGDSYSSDLWCDSSQIISCTFPDVLGTLQSWISLGGGWVSSCCSSDLVFPSSSSAPHRQRWDVNEAVQEGAHQICSSPLSLLFCSTVQEQQQPLCSWPIICSQRFPLLLFILLPSSWSESLHLLPFLYCSLPVHSSLWHLDVLSFYVCKQRFVCFVHASQKNVSADRHHFSLNSSNQILWVSLCRFFPRGESHQTGTTLLLWNTLHFDGIFVF